MIVLSNGALGLQQTALHIEKPFLFGKCEKGTHCVSFGMQTRYAFIYLFNFPEVKGTCLLQIQIPHCIGG